MSFPKELLVFHHFKPYKFEYLYCFPYPVPTTNVALSQLVGCRLYLVHSLTTMISLHTFAHHLFGAICDDELWDFKLGYDLLANEMLYGGTIVFCSGLGY